MVLDLMPPPNQAAAHMHPSASTYTTTTTTPTQQPHPTPAQRLPPSRAPVDMARDRLSAYARLYYSRVHTPTRPWLLAPEGSMRRRDAAARLVARMLGFDDSRLASSILLDAFSPSPFPTQVFRHWTSIASHGAKAACLVERIGPTGRSRMPWTRSTGMLFLHVSRPRICFSLSTPPPLFPPFSLCPVQVHAPAQRRRERLLGPGRSCARIALPWSAQKEGLADVPGQDKSEHGPEEVGGR